MVILQCVPWLSFKIACWGSAQVPVTVAVRLAHKARDVTAAVGGADSECDHVALRQTDVR